MTSCISPLINSAGKHIVTIEGLNMSDLSPVQKVMIDANGTQCGFCTVGFIVSLSGYCLSEGAASREGGISAIDGNICRCTGYKSIERATTQLVTLLKGKNHDDPIAWLVLKGFIPEYFLSIPERLAKIMRIESVSKPTGVLVGGGTDLYVQQHEYLMESEVENAVTRKLSSAITTTGSRCIVGGATTLTDLLESKIFLEAFPRLKKHLYLVSSTQIRNMSTLAGNFINASPIGDLTIFFLALNATLTMRTENGGSRTVPLKNMYKGYKTLDKNEKEYVEDIQFDLDKNSRFNFEKVSKRTNLDIASVNSAIQIKVEGSHIKEVAISAGGVGPIPIFLERTCEFLEGKELSPETISEAAQVLASETSPISDARGTKEYKGLLLRQLFYAHFIELFPEIITLDEVL